MGIIMPATGPTHDEKGCAFILDQPMNGGFRRCGKPHRRGSSYCRRHHALCHLRRGSTAESSQLHELEQLAQAVGGRFSARAGGPSRHFLARLEGLPQLSFRGSETWIANDEETP
jgi:hypothetical protein